MTNFPSADNHSHKQLFSAQAQGTQRASKIVSLVLLTGLLPYIKLGPIGLPSEVQAWSLLIAWIGVFTFALQRRLIFNNFHIVLFAFCFLFIIYLPTEGVSDTDHYFRKSMAFFMSLSITFVATHLQPGQMLKLLKLTTILWFVFAVLGQFDSTRYLDIVTTFVPNALGSTGQRGVTSLAPEATDFGFTMAYFWVLAIVASNSSRARGGPIGSKLAICDHFHKYRSFAFRRWYYRFSSIACNLFAYLQSKNRAQSNFNAFCLFNSGSHYPFHFDFRGYTRNWHTRLGPAKNPS